MGSAIVVDHMVVARNDLEKDVIALSFDDGPGFWTEPILDALAEYEVRATFFVCGDSIPGREDVLLRCASRGHEIGNHTTTHPIGLQSFSEEDVRGELETTNRRIEDATGLAPRLFRPPYFRSGPVIEHVSQMLGLGRPIGARAWTDDWVRPDPIAIADQIQSRCRRGEIVDLHDGRPPHEPLGPPNSPESRQATLDALRLLLPWFRTQGLRLLPVSDFLAL